MSRTMKKLLGPLLVLFLAFVGTSTISYAGKANAEPTRDCTVVSDDVAGVCNAALICRNLDADSSPQGFMKIVSDMRSQGVAEQSAIDQMNYALSYLCPEFQPAAQRAIDWAKAQQAKTNDGMWKQAV